MMDYRKIIEDLADVDTPADEELRYAAAASIRELLEKKMELTSELTLAKKCLEENEAAYADLLERTEEFKKEVKEKWEVGKWKLTELALRACGAFPFYCAMELKSDKEDASIVFLNLTGVNLRLVFRDGQHVGYGTIDPDEWREAPEASK